MYPVVKTFFFLYSLIPLPILYLQSSLLALFLNYIFRYRRKVIWNNLRQSFPEKTDVEIRNISNAFYKHFSDVIFETIKLMTISKKNLNKRVKVLNPADFHGMVSNGEGAIGIFAHYANWEWLGSGLIANSHAPSAGVYLPLKNKNINRLMLHIRKRLGNDMIRAQDSYREALKRLKKPYYLAILGDQTPTRSGSLYFSQFLGRPVAVHLGIAAIALKLKCPVAYMDVRKVKRGYYTIKVRILPVEQYYPSSDENVRRFTDLHVEMLEEIIREKPEYWLWSHKRWKRNFMEGDILSEKIKNGRDEG